MSTEIKYEIKPFQDSPGTPTVKVLPLGLVGCGAENNLTPHRMST